MGVAVNNHIGLIPLCQLGGSRTPQLMAMTHVDAETTDSERKLLGEPGVIRWIGIAENRAYGRYQRELVEYFLAAYISRVENQSDTSESFVHLGSHLTVSVGYQADEV